MPRARAIVVGAGGISKAWFKPLKVERVQVAAVVDLDLQRARAAVETWQLAGARASDNLAKTLRETHADFLVDLTAPESHAKVTCAALRAGLHVVGEKPMASSMAEARRMVRTSEAAGRLYMVSQSRRWDARHEAEARHWRASRQCHQRVERSLDHGPLKRPHPVALGTELVEPSPTRSILTRGCAGSQRRRFTVARAAIVCGLALSLAFWAASCTPSAREKPRGEAGSEGQLLSVARTYLEVHHPDWVEETYRLPSMILDEGDYWEVRFRLPENMVGGTPVIQIDKTTMNVIKAFHEQ